MLRGIVSQKRWEQDTIGKEGQIRNKLKSLDKEQGCVCVRLGGEGRGGNASRVELPGVLDTLLPVWDSSL